MRILFVVDGRSPIALNWVDYFIKSPHEVHLASTFPCDPMPGFASQQFVPVAFSGLKRGGAAGAPRALGSAARISLRTRVRQWLGPLTLPAAARSLAACIRQVQPDLVHAMRIPYEGMLAALALRQVTEPAPPLLVSVWGNDFTLHARANPWMASLTRQALRAAQALHTDCQRDQRLAAAWGFDPARPTVVLPGAGGIQSALFYPPAEGAPSGAPLVVNPRGFRAYVRSDTFFKAIPLVLQQHPQTRFACPTMAGEAQAERWLDRLAVRPAVELLPRLPRSQMAQLFRRAQVVVSPATHDGTPNTLLEAMACGCFPIAGNLESLREWITPGENGLLFNPADPAALAGAILRALQEPELRKKAACSNLRLIAERAAYEVVMPKAEAFYSSMTKSPSR